MDVTIRAAVHADVSDFRDLRRLRELARLELDNFRGADALYGVEVLQLDPHYPATAQPTVTEIYLAQLDGITVGFLSIVEDAPQDRIAIVEIFVEAEARAIGVGETLRTFSVDLARERRRRYVDAFALPGMRESKNFFEAGAFISRLITMRHQVEPDPN
jgi:GNAT superfamily N-acetyltransferase